jgi:hypothetical protein
MQLCYDLARQAIEDRIIAINNVIYKGQSYNISDEELEDFFNNRLSDLKSSFGMGGGYGMGMGMGGMYGGMGGMYGGGMGGMYGGGMGGMYGGFGGMGGGGINPQFRQGIENPENIPIPPLPPEDYGVDEWTSREMVQRYVNEKTEEKQKLKSYLQFEEDDLIPPEIIVEYNEQMEAQGEDYYIKRSLTLDCDADYRAILQYFYNIEFGPRVNTINAITMENLENEIVNAVFDVEGHFLSSVQEEETEDDTAGTQIGMQ